MGGDARHRFAFSRHRPSGTSDAPASLNQRGRSVVAGRTSTTLIERAAACIVAGGIDIKALPEGARQRHCAQRVTVPDGGSCTIACPARPPHGLIPRSLEGLRTRPRTGCHSSSLFGPFASPWRAGRQPSQGNAVPNNAKGGSRGLPRRGNQVQGRVDKTPTPRRLI